MHSSASDQQPAAPPTKDVAPAQWSLCVAGAPRGFYDSRNSAQRAARAARLAGDWSACAVDLSRPRRRILMGAPDAARFEFYVRRSEDPAACWGWAGTVNADGYGRFRGIKSPVVGAHRFSWESIHGAIPPNLFVCHRCDNPICSNPTHLFLGTCEDNNRDRHAKGRTKMPPVGAGPAVLRARTTHCVNGHLYDALNTHVTRKGTRDCRECSRQETRRYRQTNRSQINARRRARRAANAS